MSDEPNVWQASEAASAEQPNPVHGVGAASDELPPVVDLFMQTVEDFKVSWKGYLKMGLGVVLLMFIVLFAIIGISVVPLVVGIVSENEVLIGLGFAAYMLGILGGTALVMGPTMYAVFSATNAHLDGQEGALTFTSGLGRLLERPVGAISYQVIAVGLSMVGVLFFIVGVWVVQIALGLALPAMVVHKMGVIPAISRSFGHFRSHPKWHLGFWGLGLVVMMIAGNIPIVGYAIGLPFFASYTLRGYRVIFGNNAHAVE